MACQESCDGHPIQVSTPCSISNSKSDDLYVPVYKTNNNRDCLRGPYLVPAVMNNTCSPVPFSLSGSLTPRRSSTVSTSTRRNSTQRLVNRLKNTNPEKFNTMCKMHLSFLLDLSGPSLEELLTEPKLKPSQSSRMCSTPVSAVERLSASMEHTKAKRHHLFSRKKTPKADRLHDKTNSPPPSPLSQDDIEIISPIMQFVGRPENICQEGLFRKTGQLARQRLLRERLFKGCDVHEVVAELSTPSYSAHDGANLIKTLLGELSEPLLTESHYNIQCQVANMINKDTPDEFRELLQGRQLQAIQLLFLLLPRENIHLLDCLLHLLYRVVQEPNNKMTADTLGTLFAPHVMIPKKMSPCEIRQNTSSMTRAVSFMIEHAPSLFRPPLPLVRDIDQYWNEVEEGGSYSPEDEQLHRPGTKRFTSIPLPDVVNTTVTFVDRAASQSAAAHTDTQTALAELYAHVSAMPKSSRQKKILKQFNKANGNGTPMVTPQTDRHKRSRTLGESIKRMVSRNHRRKPSSHSTNVNPVTPSVTTRPPVMTPRSRQTLKDEPNVKKSTTSLPENNRDLEQTPVPERVPPTHLVCSERPIPVKLAFDDQSTPTAQTPIKISSGSPLVHIVDMKQSCENCSAAQMCSPNGKSMLARKRKLQLIDITPAKSLGQLFTTDKIQDDHEPHVYLETYCQEDLSDEENIESPPLPSQPPPPMKNTTSCDNIQNIDTPDRKHTKPTAYISPISRSLKGASKLVQVQAMTPRSRKPLTVLQSP